MPASMEHSPDKLWIAIQGIHYAFPALCFFYFSFALCATVCTLKTVSLRVQDQHVRRNVIFALILGISATYLVEAIAVAIQCVVRAPWSPNQDRVVYLLASTITFGIEALALTDTKFPVWYPYYGTWFLGTVVEIALVVAPNIFWPPRSAFDFVSLVIQCLRVGTFITLICLYFGLRNDRKLYDNSDEERQKLLSKKLAAEPSSSEESIADNGYGAITSTNVQASEEADNESVAGSEDSWAEEERTTREAIQKRLQQDGNWYTYAKGFMIFFPYVWPLHSKVLQFRAVLVGVCLLAGNALNVLVPRQLGIMIDHLDRYVRFKEYDTNIWLPVVIYAILLFVSGGACIGWLRKWLWLPIEQYSYDAITTASHAHIMSLSSDFHDSKTSSDLTQAVREGRSINNLLETVCFEFIPMIIDLAVAFVYLTSLFGPYMALILAVEAIVYLYITTKLIALRSEKRREYIKLFRKEWTAGQQSLDGWITASLFNQIPYERRRYASAVKQHMTAKRTYDMSSQAISAVQGSIMTIGLLGALFLGVYQVATNIKSVGNLTTLLVYWAQLQSPLRFFSTMYKEVSYSLMDAERLLELFQTKPTVLDDPDAKPLKLVKGEVVFDSVAFSYDHRKSTLKNFSFVASAGKTVALVGETGGGKSTILKLISRFYDVNSGSISVDGQDIRKVKLDSLREMIGVVPQDPVLFNDSIMNNIRYARLTASDKDVYEACEAAAIHDKIMSFPDGYNSKVGDRGVKLSGGEKQRVAIARAILKQPEIILLDEATSAVDTDTEGHIQEGLNKLCENRTTFVVAHRLSTIMRADRILVIMNGEIVEEGSHFDLIHKRGKYHELWSKQVFIKSTDARSRSRSPVKKDAELINDLNPGRSTDELATSETIVEPERATETKAKEDSAATDESEHKKLGPKLKPNAPEFVPLLSTSSSPKPLSKSEAKAAAKAQKKQEKEASIARKSGRSITKSGADTGRSSGDETQSAGAFSDIPTATPSDKPTKVKRRPFSKRHLARSEPNQATSSHDGAQDSEGTAMSSGEGQPVSQFRRVSAPSDPPAGPQDRPRGRGRPRHWRVKNRAAENLNSNSNSGLSSVTTSEEGGASTQVPQSSPAEGVVPSTTTIRFVPGC